MVKPIRKKQEKKKIEDQHMYHEYINTAYFCKQYYFKVFKVEHLRVLIS